MENPNPEQHYRSIQMNLNSSIDNTDISIDEMDVAREAKKDIQTTCKGGVYQVSISQLSPVLVKKKKTKVKVQKGFLQVKGGTQTVYGQAKGKGGKQGASPFSLKNQLQRARHSAAGATHGKQQKIVGFYREQTELNLSGSKSNNSINQ